MKITNEIILNSDGLQIVEVFNNTGKENTFDYYFLVPDFPLEYVFGVMVKDRFSAVDLVRLWENGYFDTCENYTEWLYMEGAKNA